jgi:hypothetical protein
LHALLVGVASRHAQEESPPTSAAVAATDFAIELVPDLTPSPPGSSPDETEPSPLEAAPRTRAPVRASAPLAQPLAEEAVANAAPAGPAGDDTAPPSAASSAAAPHLSLSQLGVDGANPFIDRKDRAALQAARAARVQARLDKALAQGIVNQDSAAGRGSGSPVLRALEGLVYASTLPLNTHATLSFVIDSSGKVVSSSLGEADVDRPTWLRIAHETARALATRSLRVPQGKNVRLTVAITSRLELPSGADPGLEVDVLGVPVKKGAGPRSTKLDLLNPKNGLVPLSLLGDPADAGARPRRMVNAHVVSEELL